MNARLSAAVKAFWSRYAYPPSRPCNLERIAPLALPVAMAPLANLSVQRVNEWLLQRGIYVGLRAADRGIRGAFLAFGGQGLIFFDSSDSENERRYTIGHELGHFIDYWSLRQQVIERFGSSIVDVLDGKRAPSAHEQVKSLLNRIPLGVWSDFTERSESGDCSIRTDECERVADEVALALIAPAREVINKARLKRAGSFAKRRDRICGLLEHHFGLPPRIARTYGPSLLIRSGMGYSWTENIRQSFR